MKAWQHLTGTLFLRERMMKKEATVFFEKGIDNRWYWSCMIGSVNCNSTCSYVTIATAHQVASCWCNRLGLTMVFEKE